MKKWILLFLILIGHSSIAATMKQGLLSPVTTDAAPYFWSGTAITTYLLITEDQISDQASRNTSNRKPLGDASKLGDLYGQLYPNAIYTLGMLGHGLFFNGRMAYVRARDTCSRPLCTLG